MREAVLEELGLMPLWRLRPISETVPDAILQSSESLTPADVELTVVDVLRADGAHGWVLLEKALTGDAAVLFSNMLDAMGLRKTGLRQINYARLNESVTASGVQWLWVVGEKAARHMSESGVPLSLFVSVHPDELVIKPLAKAEVWAGWCSWLRG
ncbi:hypothetical protein CAP31_06480 [Sulfuriferula sp. AH1]|uniref:DNA polymerase III subunit psi n=1 Tax=Sulfuriferula sp. AH1 TaxID=1985873 RepID=UPI000B3B4416|nr:DNA polymerase III subunit psi [Sulfuriferula sp. AH1]ARU31361.1 hypothetical protein CAP31_06480 [Sulfuriferula sp. AH1]